MNIPEAN